MMILTLRILTFYCIVMLKTLILTLFLTTINCLDINHCNKIGEISNTVNGFDFIQQIFMLVLKLKTIITIK